MMQRPPARRVPAPMRTISRAALGGPLLSLFLFLGGCSPYGIVNADPPPIDAAAFPPPGAARVCQPRAS